MNFESLNLNQSLISILAKHGITTATEIQTKTFPSAANGHDIIGISQTGSGKTLAFLLPLLQQILLSDKPFHALILAPTRELAQQIADTLAIFTSLNIRYSLLLGGEDFNSQTMSINKKPHIVIGTPGRIVKHIEKNKNFYIERIRKLVFDEADRFFELDFTTDLDLIAKKLTKKNQTLMFTATITEKTKALANIFMRSPKVYGSQTAQEPLGTISESFALIPEKYKLAVLYNFLKGRDSSAIVFIALCSNSQKIGRTLQKLGISCEWLHGKMLQAKREETIKKFRSQEFRVLVSTDVASRGLDIPHVETIVNYDFSDSSKTYTHRIGRTARAGREGAAITFVTQYDAERLQKLEFKLGRSLEPQDLKNYEDYGLVKEAFDEVNAEFNLNKDFRK